MQGLMLALGIRRHDHRLERWRNDDSPSIVQGKRTAGLVSFSRPHYAKQQ
jgi:hypothetical protein